MPHAEMHGKISRSGSNLHERLEDLLTSDVFGRLRYLAPENGIVPLLQVARNAATGRRGLPIDVTGPPVITFWPSLSRSEPDLLISLPTAEGEAAVVVECKHLSPKSGQFAADEDAQVELELARSDQLAREFQDLEEMGTCHPRFLLYITGHRALPRYDFGRSAEACQRQGLDPVPFWQRSYWIGWPLIWHTLCRCHEALTENVGPERLVLGDIISLLYHKGYRSFMGFPYAVPLPRPGPGTLWYTPVAQRFQSWSVPPRTLKERGPAPQRLFYQGGTRCAEST